jgi:adenosylhomocysteine nucleosidase
MSHSEPSSEPAQVRHVRRLGVVAGLAVEAEIAGQVQPSGGSSRRLIAVSGADSARARTLAEGQIAEGVGALLSFGIAGGLAPQARSGRLLLPEAVLLPAGGQIACDPAWRAALANCLRSKGLEAEAAPLQGSDRAIASPQDKADLHRTQGAFAVDMESHAVAAAAQAAGLPFLVLRAVADPAGRSLPGWALSATGADGRLRLGAALGALCRRPWDLPASIRLGWETRRALNALGRAVRLCPGLGLPL